MKIYISMPIASAETDFMTDTFLTPRSLAALESVGEIERNQSKQNLTADELVEQAQDADILLCGWGTVKFTKEVTDRLPNLKMIAYTAGSMVPVLDSAGLPEGVVALTGNYMFAKSVAEGCVAYMLCYLRELEPYMQEMRNGGWRERGFYNRGLYGKKIGLVGFGEIAKNLVGLLKPFCVDILVNSGHMSDEEAELYGVTKVSREEIFSNCDIVSLHLGDNDKTKGCIHRALLERLKPNALLVNTARAGIVDVEAMTELLGQKRFGAVLDVFREEPLPADNPLRKMENVMLIPHMGGPTIDMREQIVLSFAEDFAAFEQGKPLKNQFRTEALSHMSKN